MTEEFIHTKSREASIEPTQIMVLGTGSKSGNTLRGQVTAVACNRFPSITRIISCGSHSTLNPELFSAISEARYTGEEIFTNLDAAARARVAEGRLKCRIEDLSTTTGQNFENGASHVRADEALWLVAFGGQEKRARLLARKAYGKQVNVRFIRPEDVGMESPQIDMKERVTEFVLRNLSRAALIGMKQGDLKTFEQRMKRPDGFAQRLGKKLGKRVLKNHQALADERTPQETQPAA